MSVLTYGDLKRKMTRLAIIMAILLSLLSYSFQTIQAQEPPRPFPTATPRPLEPPIVRPGEDPITTLERVFQRSISGTVTGPRGEPLPGLEVKARNKNDGDEQTTTTDDRGRFRFSGIVPGPYQVTVHVRGVRVAEKEVLLGAKEAATVNFNDVPVGTPSPPGGGGGGNTGGSSAGKEIEIHSKIFEGDIELTDWLNDQKKERKRLTRIIYVSDKTSLFILETVKATTAFEYTVTPVKESLDLESLQKRINQNSKKTFVGIHRISDNSYLMVFYD